MKLTAREGVSDSAAELLTSNLVAHLRSTSHFSRVVTSKEIESLLGLEQQKQLLNCDSSSCMAELAGSLGVDFVIRGELGRLGKSWLVNVSMLNTRTGAAERTVSRAVPSDDESALLPVMVDVARELTGKPVPQAEAAPQPAPQPSAPPPEKKEGSAVPTVLKALGGVGLAGGVATLLVGLVGGGVAAGTWLLVGLVPSFTRGRELGLPLTAGFYGGLGVLGLATVLTVLALGMGTALLVAGMVMG